MALLHYSNDSCSLTWKMTISFLQWYIYGMLRNIKSAVTQWHLQPTTVAERDTHTHTTYRWTLNHTRFDLNRFVGKRFDRTVSLVSDSTLTDSLVSDSIVTDSVVSDSILTDSLVSDSILTDSVVSDSILTDSLVSDSILTDSVVSDSMLTHSILTKSFVSDSILTNSLLN